MKVITLQEFIDKNIFSFLFANEINTNSPNLKLLKAYDCSYFVLSPNTISIKYSTNPSDLTDVIVIYKDICYMTFVDYLFLKLRVL